MASASEPDTLPSYNTLFPEEQANTVINGRRRYTTITLREIYYPSGCPCHHKEDKPQKKGKQKHQPTPPPPAGAVGESKQRQVEFQPQHVRRFEILKSTPLGLVYPQNLRLEVIDLGDSKDLTSAAPLFTTSELKWWKVKMMLPPSFEIYSPHQDHLHDAHPSPSEINGLPGNKPLGHDKPYPVAQIRYPGWEGMSHLHVDITLYNFTPEMHFDPTLHSLDDNSDIRSHWTVKRVGCKREYSLSCTSSPGTHTSYTWRSRAKSEILTLPDVDDGHAAANGNLCLETPAGEIVAVYKQRRDYRVLGALTVFQDTLDSARKYSSNQDANTGNVHPSIEAIVASCLALVLYERIGGQSLFGS